LITRIDETKLIENIIVENIHDLTTRLLAICCCADSLDEAELVTDELADDGDASNNVGGKFTDISLLSNA
jgi:hypothetical protein